MLKQLVRNTLAASAISLPLLMSMAPEAIARKDNFQVHNDSSYNIYYLYISESSLDTWGPDILGQNDILSSGEQIQIIFNNPDPNVCRYDIRAEFEDGEVVEDYTIDVCENDFYRFYDQ